MSKLEVDIGDAVEPTERVKISKRTGKPKRRYDTTNRPKYDPKGQNRVGSLGYVNFNAWIKEAKRLFNKEDFEFYKKRLRNYFKDYPDINGSSDVDTIHAIVVESIKQRQLLREKKGHPELDVWELYEKSVRKMLDLQKALAARRTDRQKDKSQKNTVNIAIISKEFEEEDKLRKLTEKIRDRNWNIKEFMKAKQVRDAQDGLES